MITHLIRLLVSKEQLLVLRKYLDFFIEADAGTPETIKVLKGFQKRVKDSLGMIGDKPHREVAWEYHDSVVLWNFVDAMVEDRIVNSAAEQTQLCSFNSALAIQLDLIRDNT